VQCIAVTPVPVLCDAAPLRASNPASYRLAWDIFFSQATAPRTPTSNPDEQQKRLRFGVSSGKEPPRRHRTRLRQPMRTPPVHPSPEAGKGSGLTKLSCHPEAPLQWIAAGIFLAVGTGPSRPGGARNPPGRPYP